MSIRDAIFNSLFLPQSFWRSPRGYWGGADFICPQAFGRNTYSDLSAGQIINAVRSLDADSDIATFEWLMSQGFDPGQPNRVLADRCYDIADETEKPIIGQWEVMYALWLGHPSWYEHRSHTFAVVWPSDEKYLATYGMMIIVRKIAEARGLRTPILVAHPEHIQRCYFLGRKIFEKNPAVATYLPSKSEDCFDPKSVQKWTRGPNVWLFYELLARIHHRFHGWI